MSVHLPEGKCLSTEAQPPEIARMPLNQLAPLAPALILLLGAALILVVGPAFAPRRRHRLAVAISALAVLSLLIVGGEAWAVPAGGSGNGPVKWLGEPPLAWRVLPFEPYLWILLLSLLAISLAERDTIDRLSALDQAMLFVLAAAAYGVVLAGSYPALAAAILLFDTVAALFALSTRRPDRSDFGELSRSVGRLLLGVLSSVAVMVLAQDADSLAAHSGGLRGLFSVTLWLRLGLYPLAESGASDDSPRPTRLGWTVVNLAVGLYLVSAGVSPWVVWLAGATTLLHGVLAWLEPGQERALTHAGLALAGAVLTITAAVGSGSGMVAASISVLAALVALDLTLPVLDRSDVDRTSGLWVYLPALLATASLIGVPLTLGWYGRGALYQGTWEAGALGTLALVVVAEGAGLSVLYPYWQRLLRRVPAQEQPVVPGEGVREKVSHEAQTAMRAGSRIQTEVDVWYLAGATLACIPFLIPVLGPRLVAEIPSASVLGSTGLGMLLGLAGSLLWALFLGYGRHRMLDSASYLRRGLMHGLRLGWLLHGLGYALDALGRLLLRARAVFEGEHYLAWAILLALGLGLLVLLR